MRTRKNISTISYNTPLFLKQKLDQLIDDGIITFWAFVQHAPEDDEGGTKDHIHLFCMPSKQVQTDELGQEFLEYPDEYSKPLKCIIWKTSVWYDFYLYGCHDKLYLASKNQSRKYHYDFSEWCYSDEDTFNYLVKSIDALELSPYKAMAEAIEQGLTFDQFFMRGSIPLHDIDHAQKAYAFISANTTFRNGRLGHERTENKDSGND